jgi:hypothetical protein
MDDQRSDTEAIASAGSDVDLEGTLLGRLSARDVTLTRSAAGLVAAEGNLSISEGGCGPVLVHGDMAIRNGGCGPVLAGGDVSIEYGGTQWMMSAGKASIGPNGFVGFVASPRVDVAEGGRVLLSTRQALALGAAAGIAWALVSRAVRR